MKDKKVEVISPIGKSIPDFDPSYITGSSKKKDVKFVTVSDEFIDIYKKFNVTSLKAEIDSLSKKELYLLILLCIDQYSEDNVAVMGNLEPYRDELEIIWNLQDGKDPTDADIIELVDITDDKYIDIFKIRDKNGDPMPDPLTDEQALILRRDMSLDTILDKQNKNII